MLQPFSHLLHPQHLISLCLLEALVLAQGPLQVLAANGGAGGARSAGGSRRCTRRLCKHKGRGYTGKGKKGLSQCMGASRTHLCPIVDSYREQPPESSAVTTW